MSAPNFFIRRILCKLRSLSSRKSSVESHEPTYYKDICLANSETFIAAHRNLYPVRDHQSSEVNNLQKVISLHICTYSGYQSHEFIYFLFHNSYPDRNFKNFLQNQNKSFAESNQITYLHLHSVLVPPFQILVFYLAETNLDRNLKPSKTFFDVKIISFAESHPQTD